MARNFGVPAEKAREHLRLSPAVFIFEYECYLEAKILSGTELWAWDRRLGGWLLLDASSGKAKPSPVRTLEKTLNSEFLEIVQLGKIIALYR